MSTLFASHSLQHLLVALSVASVVAAVITWWAWRRYERSPQLHFGKFGTGIMIAIIWITVMVLLLSYRPPGR